MYDKDLLDVILNLCFFILHKMMIEKNFEYDRRLFKKLLIL